MALGRLCGSLPLIVGLTVFAVSGAQADEVSVPVELQIDLLGRVARYERGFARHAGEEAVVLVVVRARDPESLRVAAQLVTSLDRAHALGGRTVRVSRHEFTGEAALRTELDRSHPTVLYLAAGLGADIPAIVRAVGTRSVITVSAIGSDVDRGAVLGFELVSSRPQIAINLEHARTQQLDFSAQILRLARVVR